MYSGCAGGEWAFCDGGRYGVRRQENGKKITTRQVTRTVSVERETQLRVSCTGVALYALVDDSYSGSVRGGSGRPDNTECSVDVCASTVKVFVQSGALGTSRCHNLRH